MELDHKVCYHHRKNNHYLLFMFLVLTSRGKQEIWGSSCSVNLASQCTLKHL